MNKILLALAFGIPSASLARTTTVTSSQFDPRRACGDCDDGNPLTMDTCDTSSGTCEHECNDGNACTREAVVDGVCQYVDESGAPDATGLIVCDDNNPFTLDVCIPNQGCSSLGFTDDLAEMDEILDTLPDDSIFYQDELTLEQDEVTKIIEWIKLEVNQLRTPFCWRDSYGRGAGKVLTDCPSHKEKIGALCYTPCKNGYSRQGTLDCQQKCKPGWRDDGLFCRKTEYGRGAGFPWKFGDGFNDRGMFRRCEAKHGKGKCEKHGAIVYPKCRSGYKPFGCCICRPSFSSCEDEGYADFRIDLSCAVKIEMGDPTPLICEEGLEQDGALCYPPCREGFNGVGPVCWQECDVDQVNCGAGCAQSSSECAFAVADQVIAPIIVAANIATLGATSVPAAAADKAKDTVKVGGKLYQASTKVGKGMIWLASKIQTIKPAEVVKKATLATRIWNGVGQITDVTSIAGDAYSAGNLVWRQFAQDFAQQTSDDIASMIDSRLTPSEALYIKELWGKVQYEELAATEAWNTAGLALTAVSTADVTGVTDVVAAYAKPTCMEVIPFPTL